MKKLIPILPIVACLGMVACDNNREPSDRDATPGVTPAMTPPKSASGTSADGTTVPRSGITPSSGVLPGRGMPGATPDVSPTATPGR